MSHLNTTDYLDSFRVCKARLFDNINFLLATVCGIVLDVINKLWIFLGQFFQCTFSFSISYLLLCLSRGLAGYLSEGTSQSASHFGCIATARLWTRFLRICCGESILPLKFLHFSFVITLITILNCLFKDRLIHLRQPVILNRPVSFSHCKVSFVIVLSTIVTSLHV